MKWLKKLLGRKTAQKLTVDEVIRGQREKLQAERDKNAILLKKLNKPQGK